MLLVDTSIWSAHLRGYDDTMAQLLHQGGVLLHPFVIGEIACVEFPRRAEVLTLLNRLPCAPVLGQTELLGFIERHALAGKGVGFVDIHLLASALLARVALWTRDRRLAAAAAALGMTPAT